MLQILHRVNDLAQLQSTPSHFGVEMDIHGYADRLVVHHEPGHDAIDFEEWLEAYDHAFLIANIKEEGVERRARDLILARGIDAFFMLDLSFPAIVKMVRSGESRVAVRVSEYESAAGALRLARRAGWIWLDSFEGGVPVPLAELTALHDAGFRICVVSPELHGREAVEIDAMKAGLPAGLIDAVCTKYPQRW
jgi:hypothetical protein